MKLPEKLKTQDLYDIPTLLLIMNNKINEIIDYLEQYEQQKPNEDKTKLLGYANRAIRTSDAVYNTDLRENL